MSNVVKFPFPEQQDSSDPAMEFIRDELLPWAVENNLDINSQKFKLNAATIMSCLQGMLLDGI